MKILGIETSCDETAIALIETDGRRLRVLAHLVASQVKLHAKYGGVVPNIAKGEHQKTLVPLLICALRKAGESEIRNQDARNKNQGARGRFGNFHRSKIKHLQSILAREPELLRQVGKRLLRISPPNVDAIAVTVGPGLAPALWVGVNFARVLSLLWDAPVIPVNHLEGHILTNLLSKIREAKSHGSKVKSQERPTRYTLNTFRFPALCLVVSGGHTELVVMVRFGKYRLLGETLDDAAGEAFDKVAKMMRLGFPGGPIISKLAERGDPSAFSLPRPMLGTHDFNFSFSGLKTAVLYTLRDVGRVTPKVKRDISASFQRAAVDVLVTKTVHAAVANHVKTVMIGGGVAANRLLRKELGRALKEVLPKTNYITPSLSLTGDNALMIALAGYFNRKRKSAWRHLHADPNLRLGKARL